MRPHTSLLYTSECVRSSVCVRLMLTFRHLKSSYFLYRFFSLRFHIQSAATDDQDYNADWLVDLQCVDFKQRVTSTSNSMKSFNGYLHWSRPADRPTLCWWWPPWPAPKQTNACVHTETVHRLETRLTGPVVYKMVAVARQTSVKAAHGIFLPD